VRANPLGWHALHSPCSPLQLQQVAQAFRSPVVKEHEQRILQKGVIHPMAFWCVPALPKQQPAARWPPPPKAALPVHAAGVWA